jgi:formylglycine-generating enzyme required for sulfatase activity
MGSSDADMQKTLAECNATEGADTGRSCQAAWFKEPQRVVSVGDFQIARDETTNAQYNACVAAGVCRKAGERISDNTIAYDAVFFADNYPVVGVNLNDATTFCQWVGGRLPTEVEWERAARGGDGRRYPWGDTFDSSRANLGSGHPSPVGSFPAGASPYGVLDMAGNVFEWTATQEGGNYVIRGGGWSKYYFRGRVTDRGTQLAPDFANYDIGFRCAR